MRYNVHSPCAFHSRIAKSLGVLVGAALVATLGLPSAVQAQTPAAPMVGALESETSSATLTATWGEPLNMAQDQWLLEYTEPDVAWDDATKVFIDDHTVKTSMPLPAGDPRIHHGVWRFRVAYYNTDPDGMPSTDDAAVIGDESAITDYLHGPPATAPTGFAAHLAGPDALRLVWDDVTGAKSYELRYSSDPTDDDEWEGWDDATNGMVIDELDTGTEYTLEVRALGASRAGVGDLHGPEASTTKMIPVPTPTLPEIAALFLAMLLLGSGAYLLRRRQSGGLTPA